MPGVYENQQFGRPLRFGAAPALLMVDFVNGFLDPELFGGPGVQEAAARTGPLLAAARDAGIPVAHTRIVYAEDGSDAGVWCEKAPRLRLLTETAEASAIVAPLAPRLGEIVIRKTQASAFFATDLARLLRLRGADTLLIAGCTTSGCVRASVVDAISHDFRPFVVADCVGDRADGPHKANLFDMGQKYADLISRDEAVARLRG